MKIFTNWLESSKLFNRPDSAAELSHIKTVYTTFFICWAAFLVFDWTRIDLPRKRLRRKDTVDWHSRVISSIHAIILCIGKHTRTGIDSLYHLTVSSVDKEPCFHTAKLE
jgi:hypothetical protein